MVTLNTKISDGGFQSIIQGLNENPIVEYAQSLGMKLPDYESIYHYAVLEISKKQDMRKNSWEHLDEDILFKKIKHEVSELESVLVDGEDVEVLHKGVNIVNYIAFLLTPIIERVIDAESVEEG